MTKTPDKNDVIFGNQWISIEDINHIAFDNVRVSLSTDSVFLEKIHYSERFLNQLLAEDGVVYGVTTGYGDSCMRPVSPSLVSELPKHLTRFHGCGLGDYFSDTQTRAIMGSEAHITDTGRIWCEC